MKARLMVVAALTCLSGCGGGAPAPSSPPGFAGVLPTTVTYCTDGGKALTLDVYAPQRGPALHPLLLVVHGGSWTFGSSALDEQNALTRLVVTGVLARGFVVASINYRLAPADPWPAQIVDTRCALRYLRATAAHWRLDPSRFTAIGNSAGGQLVSLDALSAGQVPQWDTGQYAGQSSALAAVVDCWGPADLAAPGWSAVAVAIGKPVFGVAVGSHSDALSLASPVAHVHPGAPPFFIVQGAADALVPPQQAAELAAGLLAAGDPATLIEVAHAGHELRPVGGAISPTLGVLVERVVAFLAEATG